MAIQNDIGKCDEALKIAAYNRIEVQRSDSFSYDLKSFFLSDKFNEWLKDQDSEFSVGLPQIGELPPIDVTATSTDSEVNTFKEHIERMLSEEFERYSDFYLKKQIVSKDALDAWSKCMARNTASDIEGSISESGEYVDLQLRWNRVGAGDEIPKILAFYYQPLIPIEPFNLQNGGEINTFGVVQKFKRPTTSEEIILSLSTTRGTWQDKIDKILPPDQKPTILEIKIDPTVIGLQPVGLTPPDRSGKLSLQGRWSAWASKEQSPPDKEWFTASEGVEIHITNLLTSKEDVSSYKHEIIINPNSDVSVAIRDQIYNDNRSHPTDPLRAILTF